MEIQPCVGRRAGLPPSTWSVPNVSPKSEQSSATRHPLMASPQRRVEACGQPLRLQWTPNRGDGAGPTQKSPKSPKSNESQFKTTPPPPNSALPIPPNPPVDSSLRPTTEKAGAPERDVDPDFHRGDGVGPTQKSPKSPKSPKSNESQFKTDPPTLDTPRRHRLYSLLVPLRHPRRSIAPFSHPRCLAAFRARRGGRFRDSFQVPARLRL